MSPRRESSCRFRHMRIRTSHDKRRPQAPPARSVAGATPRVNRAGNHHLLDLGDGLGRVEALRAGVGAVHDRVAAIEPERIVQVVEALAGGLVAAVDEPAIGLEQRRRAEEAVAVPPVARAGGRAAGAQDALVEAVELRALLRRLAPLRLGLPASRSAARARWRRAGRRSSSGRARDPSAPACAAADRS